LQYLPQIAPMLLTVFRSGFVLLCISVLFIAAIPPKDNLADDVLKYTNQFRKSRGLAALEMRNELNTLARKHSEDMANGRKSFGHSGYDKRAVQIKKVFGSCKTAENVAYGATDGKDAVTTWKNSSGHRKNMLGDYRYIGIGTARNKRGVIYYTQIFVR